jgi:uncharacterized repeat protein (TIGR03806 family)
MARSWFLALCALALMSGASAQPSALPSIQGVNMRAVLAERPAETLAAYRLFVDAGARQPNELVIPYGLNTGLYSDGALKFRYVFVPAGESATYREDEVFAFPVGTVLVKTFAFAADMRRPGENVRFLETRLIIRQADGWAAYPYVWNADGTEAVYSPIGATIPTDFIDENGAPTHLDWTVPNQNQCKGCHDRAGDITPIGPTARNLNRNVVFSRDAARDSAVFLVESQLDRWAALGLISGTPRDAPRAPSAYDPSDGTLDARARAYLHVNCAHCHNPEGPAHTSGLDLRWTVDEPAAWGVRKRPVAAGRASAGMEFSIAPGEPDRSILLHRMESLDPGVMMPELGRQTVDARGIALIRDWIAGMGESGRPQQ